MIELHWRELCATDAPHPDSKLKYQSTDLCFGLNADGRAGIVVTHSPAGLVAAAELALEAALLAADGLLIHAVAGVVLGQGWLLAGPSGTGKTTIGRTAGFATVLADEKVVVRRTNDGSYRLWSTPFWSNGRSLPLTQLDVPLALFARPIRANTVRVVPLAKRDAVGHLIACTVLFQEAARSRVAAFDLACDIVDQTRCVDLSFPKEGPWLPVAMASL